MKKQLLLASLAVAPLAIVGSFVVAGPQGLSNESQSQVVRQGYVCPVTGETLPCAECCPITDKGK